MKVKIWGTRGSIPVPGKDTVKYGGNTTCAEITFDNNKRIIIDAGTGIRGLGNHIISEDIDELNIFLTHSHWDHIQGFPFFTPFYIEDLPINIYAASPTFDRLMKILKGQMEYMYFPVQFDNLGADINFKEIRTSGIELDNIKIDSIMTNHPLETHSFKFEKNGKTLVFMTDNELDHPDIATVPIEQHIKFVEKADVLIHDAQYTGEEIDKYKGWGHSSWQKAMELAEKAEVNRLYLTHYDPGRTDSELDEISEIIKKTETDVSINCSKEQEIIDI